ncbi:PepSY-associated TM helix domain-containing protein [Blastochloris sulfoviridis]|uniref:PepSY domain-containing protein n=1 Tax=Blastochloris sulfoviridis TaxID=50712 RepID=A0A5M6I1X3_9HYPH|nr:PepSY-associated TM helix domain-containing protein [Blastochloris sulfoviridis]KAA5602143.1 PepSY domain-containing protein [Blastochloris sulfoviridis]
MNKNLLHRLHRWTTLVFALPLLVILTTGLILSFEPAASRSAIQPGSLAIADVEQIIAKHDPQGQARGLMISPLDGTLTLMSGAPGGHGAPGAGVVVDLATGERLDPASPGWSSLFMTARRLHEHFVFDLDWVVTASTIAMLALIAIGVLMGLPRLRNSLSGWHKGIAWFLLPLVILSPLTGLLMAFGLTFSGPSPAKSAGTPTLVEAVRMIADDHDLAGVTWIRARGGQLMARINEGGGPVVYTLTRETVTPLPENWPRLIHEGTFGGPTGSILNAITSFALIGLLCTGLLIWAKRKLRKPQRVRDGATARA